jgi:hypothetical protein
MIRDGYLYSCRHDAYSVVVAASDGREARNAFHAWLSDKGLNVDPRLIRWPSSTKSIGNRPLLIADRMED